MLKGKGRGFIMMSLFLKIISRAVPKKIPNTDEMVLRLDAAEKRAILYGVTGNGDKFRQLLRSAEDALDANKGNIALERRIVALKYRLEEQAGGIDPLQEVDEEAYQLLRQKAHDYYEAHPLVGRRVLSPLEISRLKVASRFPAFLSILLSDEKTFEEFVQFSLRDENEVVPFIEYPSTVRKLVESNLSGRLSRHGRSHLKIMRQDHVDLGISEKFLALPFEGQYESILKPSAVVRFRGGLTLTIEEVFAVFANKEFEAGNLEMMYDGITNWNIHKLGYFDVEQNSYVQVDVSKDAWWEWMPALEILTKRQVVKRYHVDLNNGDFIAAETATRGRPNLDYEETHAFLEVAIPRADGKYLIFDFGKLATEYPRTAFDRIKMMTKTVHATVAYPDENVFYTHRQKGFHPFVLSQEKGRALMRELSKDILSYRDDNFVYQIQTENCAKWVHQKFEAILSKEKVPDLFQMQLLDSEPQGFMAQAFKILKSLPDRWQVPVFMFLHLPLGATRKVWVIENGIRVAKSVYSHEYFTTGRVYLPSLLIAKVIKMQVEDVANSSFQYLQFVLKQGVSVMKQVFIDLRLFLWRLGQLEQEILYQGVILPKLKRTSLVTNRVKTLR